MKNQIIAAFVSFLLLTGCGNSTPKTSAEIDLSTPEKFAEQLILSVVMQDEEKFKSLYHTDVLEYFQGEKISQIEEGTQNMMTFRFHQPKIRIYDIADEPLFDDYDAETQRIFVQKAVHKASQKPKLIYSYYPVSPEKVFEISFVGKDSTKKLKGLIALDGSNWKHLISEYVDEDAPGEEVDVAL